MGMSAHKAMISIVVIASLFSSLNILLVSFVNINIVFAGDIVIWVVLSIWFEKARNKNGVLLSPTARRMLDRKLYKSVNGSPRKIINM